MPGQHLVLIIKKAQTTVPAPTTDRYISKGYSKDTLWSVLLFIPVNVTMDGGVTFYINTMFIKRRELIIVHFIGYIHFTLL